MDLTFFWFRRDLRLTDNAGLFEALQSGLPVQPVFIFDQHILEKLDDPADRRVNFIHCQLTRLNEELSQLGSRLLVYHGRPIDVWKKIIIDNKVKKVFTNSDYEPYATKRDAMVAELLQPNGIQFTAVKDHVIFERSEVMKDDGTPYNVYTPYMKRWRSLLKPEHLKALPSEKYFSNFNKTSAAPVMSLQEIGFREAVMDVPSLTVSDELIQHYGDLRDIPGVAGTSRLGVHLRFGTISLRALARQSYTISEKFFNELIWREFYQMILWHYPHVTERSFKPQYDLLQWKNDEREYELWCQGKTGYPIVDAGMRELEATGYMHNRVRMITAQFLTKFLLIDWRWGEAWFAKKLMDFDLASNNGGWQWSAGTGVDAAPYFRVFNMDEQTKKFDPDFTYIRKWVPEYSDFTYPARMVDYKMARMRCLDFYKKVLKPE